MCSLQDKVQAEKEKMEKNKNAELERLGKEVGELQHALAESRAPKAIHTVSPQQTVEPYPDNLSVRGIYRC